MAIFTFFLFASSIGTYVVLHGQLVEMHTATVTTTAQLELAERPWVDASISLDGPLTYDVNGASLPLKIVLRNTGHSPALAVVIDPLPLLSAEAANAANYRGPVCQDATRIATSMPNFGITLFPNVNFVQSERIGISKEKMESGKTSNIWPDSNFGKDVFLAPSVVICIAYQPVFTTSVYHTVYVVDLMRLDSPGRPLATFTIGQNVDQKNLLLELGKVGAIGAN